VCLKFVTVWQTARDNNSEGWPRVASRLVCLRILRSGYLVKMVINIHVSKRRERF